MTSTTPSVFRTPSILGTSQASSSKPPDPIMGKCLETWSGSGDYYYTFGGKPLADWSDIDPNSSKAMSDNCLRALDPVSGQKHSRYRVKGLTKRYDSKHRLADFQDSIWEHLVNVGLDTVAYLNDPRDNSRVLNVIKNHAQFTGDLETAIRSSQTLYQKFDDWDKKHDMEAKTFLLNSLSEELKRDFKPFHKKAEDTLAITWLKLVHFLVNSNSKNFDKLKDVIRHLRPQQYPGQDIEKMAADFISKSEELINGGYFDYSLVLNMVDGFLCATPDVKGTFHHTMNDLRRNIEALQGNTVFLDKVTQADEYAKARLSPTDVYLKAVKAYKTLCDDNLWEPKKLPKDRQAPSTSNLNLATINKALNLVASFNDSSKTKSNKNVQCFNCGKYGHTVPECTEPENKALQQKLREKFLSGKRDKSSKLTWREIPPKAGESQVKTVNGKEAKWCDKCKLWSYNHSTATHKDGKKKGRKKKQKSVSFAESNLVICEPAAWLAQVEFESSPTPKKYFTLYVYFSLTLAILLGLPFNMFNTLHSFIQSTSTYKDIIIISFQSINNFVHLLVPFIMPLLWITLGIISTIIPKYFTKPFNPVSDLKQVPRKTRRSVSPPQSKVKLKSAKDFKLTPKYPHRLRKEHKFNPRSSTPTVKERESLQFFDNFLSEVQHSSNFQARSNQRRKSQQWTKANSATHPRPPKSSSQSFRHVSNAHKSKGGMKKYHNFDALKKPKGGYNNFKGSDLYHDNKHQSHSGYFCKHHKPAFKKSSRNKLHKSKPKYVPQGLATVNDSPNMNLTSTQRKHIKDMTSIFLTASQLTSKLKTMAKDISQLTPSTFRSAINSIDNNYQFEVIWDSGASVCISPNKNDFLTYDTNVDIKNVAGVNGKNSSIVGQGTVGWSIFDVNGNLRNFELKAYHIPSSKTRLISTSALLSKYKNESISINQTCLRLSGNEKDHMQPVTVPYNPMNRLPTSIAYLTKATKLTKEALCNTVTTVSNSNINLNEGQKELLRWHQRLGHLEFRKIQHLMQSGVLSHTPSTRSLHTNVAKLREFPKCAACLFGKQTAKTSPGKTSTIVKDRAGILKAGNLLPGQEVSVDHFISSVKGRLFSGFNRGSIQDKYVGGCIFVDHASANTHVEFQSSLSSHETLSAKQAYENICKNVGVIPHTYMSDNGTAFTSKEFVEHLSQFHQISKLAGVGAHHHNAQAERAIRTIMSIARTMMMHAGIHWPDVADPTLWPMAVKHSCYLFNHVPSHLNGLSPTDLFTKTRWPQRKLLDIHVWGCPVYVLDKSLQDGKKIPRWQPRSSRSVYMGVSDSHASTVPLVLNITTGSITPQFHVVFDDWFATVPSESGDIPDFTINDWRKMFGESRYQYVVDEEEDQAGEIDQANEDAKDALKSADKSDKIMIEQDSTTPSQALIKEDPFPSSERSDTKQSETHPKIDKEPESSKANLDTLEEVAPLLLNPDPLPEPEPEAPIPIKLSPKKSRSKNKPIVLGQRRSRRLRQRNAPESFYESHLAKVKAYYLSLDYLDDNLVHAQSLLPFEHVLLTQKESNPDLFSYDQAMSSEHRDDWIKAAEKEIRSLEGFDCWLEMPISQATTKVLPGTWVFKVKRAPDGSFKKFKARYCVRGDLQEGDFETYAPVVQFSSVRLFLAWSLLLDG